jgi:hypothetical protein
MQRNKRRAAQNCIIAEAVIGITAIGGAKSAADHVRSEGIASIDQMSIFSAISISSSTSIPSERRMRPPTG